jgi:hypothetical protein
MKYLLLMTVLLGVFMLHNCSCWKYVYPPAYEDFEESSSLEDKLEKW